MIRFKKQPVPKQSVWQEKLYLIGAVREAAEFLDNSKEYHAEEIHVINYEKFVYYTGSYNFPTFLRN